MLNYTQNEAEIVINLTDRTYWIVSSRVKSELLKNLQLIYLLFYIYNYTTVGLSIYCSLQLRPQLISNGCTNRGGLVNAVIKDCILNI